MTNDNFYSKTNGNFSFYSSSTSSNLGTEPNMREEMENFLDGNFPEVAKGQTILHRKMRRDADNNLILCDCVDPVTQEPDKDRFCPICLGESYLWDETEIEAYRTLETGDASNALRDNLIPPGLINVPIVVFYVRYNVAITKQDKLVLVDLEQSGSVKKPMKRIAVYRIEALWDYRSDGAKLEYWKVFTHEDKVKYLNAPSYGEV